MKIPRLAAIAPLAALAIVSLASAQHCGQGCNSGCNSGCGAGLGAGHGSGYSYHDAYWDNRIWPKQYVGPSRRSICQAYERQLANGWRKQNILGKYHFDQEGVKLTEAGRLKVQWIMTQAPPQRRTIFVEHGVDLDQTAVRVAAVQDLATTLAGGPADIQETYLRDEGRSAAAVDAMFTGFRAGSLPPVLPQSGGGGESSEQ